MSLNVLIVFFAFFQVAQPRPESAKKSFSSVIIDGSSTVQPITGAIVQMFSAMYPSIPVEATAHGTGSGFQKFIAGEVHIAQASRPISPKEMAAARAAGIEYQEVIIGFDGITLVVNPENTFANDLTLEELKMIWGKGSKVKKWNDIRSTWPSVPIVLVGPGKNHGTTDFFSEAVNGSLGLRDDYNIIESDDYAQHVNAVLAEKSAMGFITYAYYVKNFRRIKALGISNLETKSVVMPTYGNIVDKKYEPFSRPLYLYISKNELHRVEIERFLEYYLNTAPAIVKKVGYVPLTREAYIEQKDQLDMVIRAVRSNRPVSASGNPRR